MIAFKSNKFFKELKKIKATVRGFAVLFADNRAFKFSPLPFDVNKSLLKQNACSGALANVN